MKRFFLAAALLAGCSILACAQQLHLPELFSDNMVLQQQSNARIWGRADAGATVTLTCSWAPKAKLTTKAGADGRWKAEIPTPAASYAPQTVKVASGKESITLSNVLIGEVWLGSGQSNMEMPMKGFSGCPTEGAAEEIMLARRLQGKVHMVTIKRATPTEPAEEASGLWQDCSIENLPSWSAVLYFFAKNLNEALDVPVGIISCAYSGSEVECWLPDTIIPEDALSAGAPEDLKSRFVGNVHAPHNMWNGMINPIKGYNISGFLWYQGCSNTFWHLIPSYGERLTTMINFWRDQWGLGSLPFYQVELAPYVNGDKQCTYLIREVQQNVAKAVENCGIVGTSDLVYPYETKRIHPAQKRQIGERLCMLAMSEAYGIDAIEAHGPEFDHAVYEGGKATVFFKHAQLGFSRQNDILGFELCDAEGNWHKAGGSAQHSTGSVVVSSPEVDNPVGVRYNYSDWTTGNLYNHMLLPALLFQDRK